MEYEEFKKNRKTINAVVRSIELIGEASKKVPEAITDLYPGVPWKKMIKAGFFSPIDSLREIV